MEQSRPYRSRFVVVPAVRSVRTTAYGIKTHFIEAGAGEPVILLHGGSPGASGEMAWSHTVPGLASHYHAIGLDMISFGYSDKPLIDYSLQTLVDHLAGFVDAMGFDKVNLVGQSTGGYVAAKFACDHPGRTNRFVMVNTATVARAMGIHLGYLTEGKKARMEDDGSREALVRLMNSITYQKNEISDEVLEAKLTLAAQPGVKEARASLDGYKLDVDQEDGDPDQKQLYNLEHRLPRLAVPHAIIWGVEDQSAPVELGRRLHELLPRAEYYEVAEASHHCFHDQPEVVNKLLIDFFQGRSADRAQVSAASSQP